MNATMSPEIADIRPAPGSRRTIRQEGRSRRFPGFGYSAAAILLVLALFGGMFVANQRGPEDRFGDLRYAAQPVSPEATATAAQQCDVEPLSVDEVMAIVEDPYVNLDAHRINIAGVPRFLAEPGELLIPAYSEPEVGEPLAPEVEREVREITATYLACRQHGTLGQVFSILSPNRLQQTVFGQFPGFRAEEDVRALLEVALDAPAQELMFHPVFEMDVTVLPATGEHTALAWSLYPSYPVAYIGTQVIDASGAVLTMSDARDIIEVKSDMEGMPPTLGAVSLIQYPGDDLWYVHDAEIVRDMESAVGPGAGEGPQGDDAPSASESSTEAAVCEAEPVTADELLQLLDDPDAWTEHEFGSSVTPDLSDLLKAIREEPESLVLASVSEDTDLAMLVLPQEGVLPSAQNYLDCWQQGTAGQAFSLQAPHMIAEYDDLVGLPRDTDTLQALLDAPARDLPASDRVMPTYVLDEGRVLTITGTDEPHGWAEPVDGFEVAFVTTHTFDGDGNGLIGGNVDDRSVSWAGPQAEVDGRMSFGALTLVRYPGTERWLVYDHWIELDPAPVQLP
jgi:hypothetical protein